MSANLTKYLNDLDQALDGIPAGERAEIILEIKSHLMDSQAKNGGSMEAAIASMGTPSAVAARFLSERGLKPKVHYKLRPLLKWAAAIIVAGIVLIIGTVIVLMIAFSPVLKIDGENKRVSILNGFVEIDGNEGTLKVGDTRMARDEELGRFDGTKNVKKDQKVRIKLGNGRASLRTSLTNEMTWACKIYGQADLARFEDEKTVLTLNLEETSGSDCEISVPRSTFVDLNLINGKVRLERPLFHANVRVGNGGIEFIPVSTTPYKVVSKVVNGTNQPPATSTGPDGFQMDLEVTNGFIRNKLIPD